MTKKWRYLAKFGENVAIIHKNSKWRQIGRFSAIFCGDLAKNDLATLKITLKNKNKQSGKS